MVDEDNKCRKFAQNVWIYCIFLLIVQFLWQGERRKKKKKKKRRYSEEQLDSDDLDLIEDNTGVAVSRKKKYNRVRLDSDEENVDDKDKLANELFHDDEILSDDDIDQVIQRKLLKRDSEIDHKSKNGK